MQGYDSELIPFIRFEQYNTHASVEPGTNMNPSFNRTDLTVGLGWKITRGAMLKADYQVFRNAENTGTRNQFNAGIGIWF